MEKPKFLSKKYVAYMLSKNDAWLFRGLIAIYKKQTEFEKKTDSTKTRNYRGFTAFDAATLSRYARRAMKQGNFKPGETAEIRRRMLKYAKQLAKIANEKTQQKLSFER